MSKYSRYYKYIDKNRKEYDELIKNISQTEDKSLRLKIAQEALTHLSYNSSGIYVSPYLEKIFIDLAQSIIVDVYDIHYKPNSFLHIISEAYVSGGHTRVVERWISQSDNHEMHDVAILRQRNGETPTSLYKSVNNKGGKVIDLSYIEELKQSAIALRKIAMQYEYIILHIHMDDPTALVAFGTKDFTRPIILFNHADHSFWCGASIVDMVAELNESGQKRSLEKRGIARSFVLTIPIDDQMFFNNQQTKSRQQLGLPVDKKIIMTSGYDHKYLSIYKNKLIDCVSKIMKQCPDTIFVAIGPNYQHKEWKSLIKQFKNRLYFLAQVGYNDKYMDYVQSANLILDSYPVSGGTTLIDAILAHKPVLSISHILGQSNYLINSESFCFQPSELVKKAIKILNDPDYASKITLTTYQAMMSDHSPENWKKRKELMLSQVPHTHSLHQNIKNKYLPKISDEDVIIGLWQKGKNFFPKQNKKGIFAHLSRLIKKNIKKIK